MAGSIRTYKFNRLDALLDAIKSFVLEGYSVGVQTVYDESYCVTKIDHYELTVGSNSREEGEKACVG